MQSIKENIHGMIDITIVISVGIVFAALMVIAYVIWELDGQLLPAGQPTNGSGTAPFTSAQYNSTWYSIRNITGGFDDAVNLILVAITVFILAIAIAALLMLRGQRQ